MSYSGDTEKKQVEHGVTLLNVFGLIDEREENGTYDSEVADRQRRMVCDEIRSLLYQMKPYVRYHKQRSGVRTGQKHFFYRG